MDREPLYGEQKMFARCLNSQWRRTVKRVDSRKIKTALTYTFEEAAIELGVTVQTVRSWERKGMKVMRSKRPYLIQGGDLRDFLEKQNGSRKQPLAAHEMYCTRCKKPTEPFGAMADYVPLNEKSGSLISLCSQCEGVVRRFTSKDQAEQLAAHLEIEWKDDEAA